MLDTLKEAKSNLFLHKGRSLLAALGIIFGVGSVICMVSISEVARRDTIDRIERLGLRNIVLDSVPPGSVRARQRRQTEQSWRAEYGILQKDLHLLATTLGEGCDHPAIEAIAPMKLVRQDVVSGGRLTDVGVIATTAELGALLELTTERGRFLNRVDSATLARVCVVGGDAARDLFPLANPLGQVLEIGGVHFTVVGILEPKGRIGTSGGLSNPDNTVWIPYDTAGARFGFADIRQGNAAMEEVTVEVDRAIVRVAAGFALDPIRKVIEHLVETQHPAPDVTLTIPHLLMREQRQAERIFRWVMGSLGAISLLVGGVGIMNIMLANMAERRQEIGLRRALGATRSDIVKLFVSESVLLCLVGGVFGAGAGVLLAKLVGELAEWTVVFQPLSFPLAIIVSALTGLLFGTAPAIRAARVDPVLALRVE
jgi:putative ABC transport system permease protein